MTLENIVKYSKKLVTLVSIPLIINATQAKAEDPKNYLSLNAGVISPIQGFSDYNLGTSLGANVGRVEDGLGFEFGVSVDKFKAGSQLTSQSLFWSSSESENTQDLTFYNMHADLFEQLSPDFAIGVRGLVRNTRVTTEYESLQNGFFANSDTSSINFINENYAGYGLFARFRPIHDEKYDLVIEGGYENTQIIPTSEIKSFNLQNQQSNDVYIKANLQFDLNSSKKHRRR